MSQEKIRNMDEFASLCGISRPTISKYFNDHLSHTIHLHFIVVDDLVVDVCIYGFTHTILRPYFKIS